MKISVTKLSLLLTLYSTTVAGQTPGDSLRLVNLDSVIVKSHVLGGELRSSVDGSIRMDMAITDRLPKILGVADPMHYAQLLPGIGVNNEYDGGLHVFGSESGHNYISLNGAPVYGAEHLLGIFSIFNPSHYNILELEKSPFLASAPNRLGATVEMEGEPDDSTKTHGEASFGLIESEGTINTKISQHSRLRVSARLSYINLLYSSFLRSDDMSMHYSFFDTNASYIWRPDNDNTIAFDAYLGGDKSKYSGNNIYSSLNMKWGNAMLSAKWDYAHNNIFIKQQAYFTRYHNHASVGSDAIQAEADAHIAEIGYKGNCEYREITMGLDLSAYSIKPQDYFATSTFNNNLRLGAHTTHSVEGSTYFDWRHSFSKAFKTSLGLRLSAYNGHGKWYEGCSPSFNISYINDHGWDLSMSYSYKIQYLIKTGLSSLDSPLEYWIGCGTYNTRPQYAHNIYLRFRKDLSGGAYSFIAEGFVKWLRNQVEYNGTILNMLSSEYTPAEALLFGKGMSYGLNAMVMKNRGALTGWLSYAWNPSRRTFHTTQLDGTYPSSHERLHEFKGLATWKINQRLNVGATAVFASGTPYTRPEKLMILGKHLIPVFSKHNGCRLSPYMRLDLSADYTIKKTRKTEQRINLSIYNVTRHRNEIFWYVHAHGGVYYYRSMKNLMRLLPSVSYSIKF